MTAFQMSKREKEQKGYKEPCPFCGAKPGESCHSQSGYATAMHARRIRLGIFVPLKK